MSSERISFAEYVERIGMNRLARRAFETHCREHTDKFNYRTAQEWDRVRSEFLQAPRRRTDG